MKMNKPIWIVLALCVCVAMLTVCVFADNYGEEIVFGTTAEVETTEPGTTAPEGTEASTESVTTEPTGTETGAEGETSEPEVSGSEEETTAPDASESETAAPEESVTADETTAPAEQTTEQSGEQTTSVVEQPTETETQPADDEGGIPMALILAGLAVLGIACLALVVVLVIKYFRAQKQN